MPRSRILLFRPFQSWAIRNTRRRKAFGRSTPTGSTASEMLTTLAMIDDHGQHLGNPQRGTRFLCIESVSNRIPVTRSTRTVIE